MNHQRRSYIILLIIIFSFFLILSCKAENKQIHAPLPEKISLTEQYGLAYAPITAARLKGWFEEELPGVSFDWHTAGNATAVREAMLAGRLDGGFMGIPPYLIGRDRGMTWIAAAAVAEAELGLVVVRPGIDHLEEIPQDLRIALPQPGSIQHILLAMAAEDRMGDASRFDNQLITLSHPDGMAALMAGREIEAHFTSPPYLHKELEIKDARLILDGVTAFGSEFTFIVAVFSNELAENFPDAVEGIRRVISRSAKWLNDNPEEAAAFMADYYRMDEQELRQILKSEVLSFGGEIRGMNRFVEFMTERDYLINGLTQDDLIYP